MTKNYYVLEIWRDVEPILHGPFLDSKERDDCYERLRAADPNLRNGYYCLAATGPIELA